MSATAPTAPPQDSHGASDLNLRRARQAAGRPVAYVAIGLVMLTLLLARLPAAAAALQYDATAAFSQPWRLVTCHWAHWSGDHQFWSLMAFAVLGAICERRYRRRFLACLPAAAVLIPLALRLLQPGLHLYRGLSGIDSALFTLLAAGLLHDALRRGPQSHGRGTLFAAVTAAVLLAFAAKLGYEFATGSAVFVHAAGGGFAPVPLAHLAGALVGAAAGAGWKPAPQGGMPVGRPPAAPLP